MDASGKEKVKHHGTVISAFLLFEIYSRSSVDERKAKYTTEDSLYSLEKEKADQFVNVINRNGKDVFVCSVILH